VLCFNDQRSKHIMNFDIISMDRGLYDDAQAVTAAAQVIVSNSLTTTTQYCVRLLLCAYMY
jgi:hypothetical protein